ncbi:hypothetical protein CSB93_4412 [Pseudomonas paraeruginosa]|uniref:Uncharacterized protein n=1 Tax=Pseudomonas paraeruginosa TaxID=2994495 RepID=A0A2R3IRR7_9PSED|nr:hypothetical protein CSB93_4412 [Pseudomonas paraeruginosa]AWE91747.1 hypothetical protein CSC28_3202 [Pseudomonas paraeruginosa]PTC36541.1 hypothetical protein CLJ1_3034 [Pseudomonas aeruginosa]
MNVGLLVVLSSHAADLFLLLSRNTVATTVRARTSAGKEARGRHGEVWTKRGVAMLIRRNGLAERPWRGAGRRSRL